MGTSIKNIYSKKEEGGQGRSLHVLFLWRHSIVWKRARGRGCLKIIKFERTYFLDGSFVMYYTGAWRYPLHWNSYLWYILYTICYKKFNIFFINSILQDHFIIVETIIWLCLYIKEIYDIWFNVDVFAGLRFLNSQLPALNIEFWGFGITWKLVRVFRNCCLKKFWKLDSSKMLRNLER